MTEEQAREAIAGDIDVYVSKFRAMKNTITGREEKSLVKIIVEVATDKVSLSIAAACLEDQAMGVMIARSLV
jgi:pyruvate/2-oxoglutarate dehydrogenase complex dihydrolipoamide dehydrogenase (E3) component